jgi:hypothetical protein
MWGLDSGIYTKNKLSKNYYYMSSKNSFPKIAEQVVNYNNNTLNLLSQLNSLLVSNDESVKIDFTDQNNITSTFEVPSWGYLQSEIRRLNNNINSY